MKDKELQKEIEKNILECPYNKVRQDKGHRCSDCDTENDLLEAQLKGRQEAREEVLKKVIEEIDKYKRKQSGDSFFIKKALKELKQNIQKLKGGNKI